MNFKENIRKSFRKVREDIDGLKTNISEWIRFLNNKQRNLEHQLWLLEKRVKELEQDMIRRYF